MMIHNLITASFGLIRRLGGDRRGNVLMLLGFSVIPLTLAAGISIDYARAARLQTKLNAAADAAALAAVTQQMMLNDNPTAKTAAENMFNVLRLNQPGLVWANNLTVTVTGNNAVTSTRTAVVTYTAQSTNAFAGLIGLSTVTIGGTSTASATAAPNIDFYLALDTSPSMALPTTTAGFSIMHASLGCSFACHSNKIQQYIGSSIPSLILDNAKFSIVKTYYPPTGTGANEVQKIDADGTYIYVNATTTDNKCKQGGGSNKNICIYNADGTFVDSYWYAINKGASLRITEERKAAQDLMTLAQSYATANQRAYRAALYTFDHSTNYKKISSLSSDLASVATLAGAIDLVMVNDKAGNGRPPNGSSGQDYLFTSYKSIMTAMATELPATSGKGTNDAGDKPQAFLFMVTDGMSDENIGSGRTRDAMQQQQIDQCTAIKNRGVKIAILYTEYTKESIADDEVGQRTIAEAAIPRIAPALTKCASPDLMYTVRTDQSITDALQALFNKAVASARIIN